ncbi:hypothetical protein GGI15_003727 [Coemansia interrupta]|uniref:Gfo/Idh/MocA-like oxidoreductase N-terminal domain-containing protein n=1 Tax=Coemansia interrupta TaxID=1126814 RepID=A0A9W8H648_9FUNG|nr:hypothetical protein GGI15_003727 [Coemansia interrupta]
MSTTSQDKPSIKVGVVGFGMSARVFHCPLIASNSNYELAAVVERHGEKSKSKYPQVQVVRSIDDLLDMADIELVVVTTPNDTHEDQLKSGITPNDAEYGKDKPSQFGTIDSEIYPGVHARGTVTTADGDYPAYYNNVASAIRGDAELAVTADQAADVIRIIELAKQSSVEHRSFRF